MSTAKLALGTVQFGLKYGISNTKGQTNEADAHRILDLCLQYGISYLDTARGYGNSEEIIGSFGQDGFSTVSKFYIDENFPTVQQNLECSLERLQVNSLYAYMAHDANQLIETPFLWEELQNLKAAGKIQKTGYSLYRTEQLETLLEMKCFPDIVQVPFSILDHRFEPFFPGLKEMGCEIHTRSAFLQGLFFMEADTLNAHFNPVKNYLRQLQQLFESKEQLAAYLLQFCLKNNYVDKVVFGVNTPEQLKSNVQQLSESDTTSNGTFFRNTTAIPDSIIMPDRWPSIAEQ